MNRPTSSRSYSYYAMGTGSSEVTTLRHYIRSIDGSQVASILHSSDSSLLPAEISVKEKLRVGSKEISFRRVFLHNHMYKVGWVVDFDIDFCMLCAKDFSWFRGRAKHHCRACGLLICYKCSPNMAEVPYLGEEKMSRVCKECFGIKPGIMTPQQKNDMIEELVKTVEEEERFIQLHREEQEQLLQHSIQRVSGQSLQKAHSQTLSKQSSSSKKAFLSQSVPSESFMQRSTSTTNRSSLSGAGNNRAHSPLSSARVVLFTTPDDANITTRDSLKSTSSRRAVTTTRRQSRGSLHSADDTMLDRYEEEMRRWENEQRPLYEESYRMMRELIPLDIYKSSMRRLVDQGVPLLAANRIWNTKILWLICTHRDDIVKIHLADFRSKYAYDGLDLVEMRAIWYNLPEWDVYSSNPLEKGKAEWKDGFKAKLDEMSYKEAKGTLPPQFCRHPAYDDCILLHTFDPHVELRPRFHRSASFKQQAVESPMEGSRPLTKEEEEDLIWRARYAATTPQPGLSISERKKAYMDNFLEDDEDGDGDDRAPGRAQRKFQRYLDEVNGDEDEDDEEDDDDDYALDDDDADDISSLGLESNVPSESNTPYQPTPFAAARPSSQRLDIATIPELTTPESMSSTQDTAKGPSSLPSPKTQKQPRSQLLQQARPLAAAGGAKKPRDSKAAKRPRGAAKATKDEFDRDDEDDEAAKAKAREDFLAARRAKASSASLSSSPAPSSSLLQSDTLSVASGRSQSTISATGSAADSASAAGKSRPGSSATLPPAAATVLDTPSVAANTSRNSSFSTTTSAQSRGVASLPSASQSSLQPTSKPSSFSVAGSQSSSGLTLTTSATGSTAKSRDVSPLPPLRHQPTPPRPALVTTAAPAAGDFDYDDHREDAAPASTQRPFAPLTRSLTQALDDRPQPLQVAAVSPADDADDGDDDASMGVIETHTPAFFSPSDATTSTTEPPSTGGDTFRSVESADPLATPLTPASAQSYKFLSHSKKFGVTIDDSPSVLLTTQQRRQQQRLLSQRDRRGGGGGHVTPNQATQTLLYTADKPAAAATRGRGFSHDTQASSSTVGATASYDLYQPGSDDRSYRRGSAIVDAPRTISPAPETPADADYDLLTDQLANDAAGVSPLPAAAAATAPGLLSPVTPSTPAASKNSLRADILRALFEEDTELVYDRLGDEPLASVFDSEADATVLSRIFWQCLLMQRYQTVLFLIDEAVMDVDVVCEDGGAQAAHDGRSALHYAVAEQAESFGRQLIRRGANIFLVNQAGESPLSLAMKSSQVAWLMEEFQAAGEEEMLAASGSDADKLQYISFFVLSGVAAKVKALLATGRFTLSSSQATTLLNACKGNFEQMEDPVDTFELLMSLDADMAD